MPTPNPEVLFVYDAITGVPYTGLASTLSFATYIDDTGTPVTPPTITKVTNGIFKFTPVFTGHAIYYVVTTGQAPSYLARYMRPEESNSDSLSVILSTLQQMQKFEQGRWKLVQSGGDANRLVIYDVDGITTLAKFDLKDGSGNPTTLSIFERVPV